MIIDASGLDATAAYKLLIGSILPRAIAWVSTVSKNGVGNIAPVSFFTAVGRKPPMVSISLQPRSDGQTLKDTFVNIRDTGEFVTNLAVLPLADRVHRSAAEFDCAVDEFEVLGLEKAPCEVVRFHVRDDLYLERGRIDTAALPVVGRLAAEYTLVNNVFFTPLDEGLLEAYEGRRMARLDGRETGWSPIDTPEWSPSGAATGSW